MEGRSSALVAYKRTLIIGNGGSGKTWLARRLGEPLRLPIIHLDDMRWAPGHRGVARDDQLVADEALKAADAETWVMEGVYGWLANVILSRVTMLIWIDLPEDECISNVRARGIPDNENEKAFQEFLKWVSEYRQRSNSSAFAAHSQLFEAFSGSKSLLKSRDDIAAYLDRALSLIAVPQEP